MTDAQEIKTSEWADSGAKWAEGFRKVVLDQGIPVDEDLMLGWFCNAILARLTPVDQHPDDAAVDRFAEAMKAKLAAAREKGRGGWDDPGQCSVEFLASLLLGHISKGNPGNFEDIANLCMMLHQRGAQPSVLSLYTANRGALMDLMSDSLGSGEHLDLGSAADAILSYLTPVDQRTWRVKPLVWEKYHFGWVAREYEVWGDEKNGSVRKNDRLLFAEGGKAAAQEHWDKQVKGLIEDAPTSPPEPDDVKGAALDELWNSAIEAAAEKISDYQAFTKYNKEPLTNEMCAEIRSLKKDLVDE